MKTTALHSGRTPSRWHREKLGGTAGFSLLEMMVVVAIMGILGSMAMIEAITARRAMQADSGMRLVMAQLNTARERAITERRFMQVNFLGTNSVQITRMEVPAGTTVLTTVWMEGNVEFSDLTAEIDTPDAFGNEAPVSFGGAPAIMFGTDGSLIDNTGTPVNGTVFLSIANQPESYRAVTVLGSVGRIRAYRWSGLQWNRV